MCRGVDYWVVHMRFGLTGVGKSLQRFGRTSAKNRIYFYELTKLNSPMEKKLEILS